MNGAKIRFVEWRKKKEATQKTPKDVTAVNVGESKSVTAMEYNKGK